MLIKSAYKQICDILKSKENTSLSEKAVSIKQQQLFGMVHAYNKGELKKPSKKIKDIAKTTSKSEVKKIAKTKHAGLPLEVSKK